MSREKLNIAIVGLGFGKEFIPIYQHHPEYQHVRDLPAYEGEAGRSRRTISVSTSGTKASTS